jgi:hypothetical protein
LRKWFLGLSLANFLLFVFLLAWKVAESSYVALSEKPFPVVVAGAIFGFILTWPFALIAALRYGAAPDLGGVGERSMYCRSCGYMLIGLTEMRCPECSLKFDPEDVLSFRRYPRKPSTLAAALARLWLFVGGVIVVFAVAFVIMIFLGIELVS